MTATSDREMTEWFKRPLVALPPAPHIMIGMSKLRSRSRWQAYFRLVVHGITGVLLAVTAVIWFTQDEFWLGLVLAWMVIQILFYAAETVRGAPGLVGLHHVNDPNECFMHLRRWYDNLDRHYAAVHATDDDGGTGAAIDQLELQAAAVERHLASLHERIEALRESEARR